MTSGHPDLYAGFTQPDPRYSPAPIWWWDGERVELSRLCWQLDQLADRGVYNVLPVSLAPGGPAFGASASEPAPLTDDWWSLWTGLVEHARTRGVRLWFYDQIGFAGANLQGRLVSANPAFVGAQLERECFDVDGPCDLAYPSTGSPISACALPLNESGTVTGAPVPVGVDDGRILLNLPGRHRVLVVCAVRQGYDYLSPDACGQLLDAVHGEFERRLGPLLGSVIAGSFQDELPSLPTWSTTFADEFARRKGYRIEPVIAALWEDWGLESYRARADYQRVRAALAEEAFFEPLFRWHDKWGMSVGCDQQSPARAGEPVACTRQYADYARTHRWYQAPGSDHWGDAKIHSSLAHHYGRGRTWIEAFHSSGWGGTLEETFDWLLPWLLAGATLYSPHAVYYSTRGGWWEWAAPSTCWRQPYWRHYRGFADTVSRLCWLLTQGAHACDVGVLFPSATTQAATLLDGPLPDAVRAQDSYLALVGRMAWFYTVPGVLSRAGRDFDILDDDTVAAAEVADGTLRTRAESYRAIVVPSSRFLEPTTASRLAAFCERGGLLVLAGDVPEEPRLRELAARGIARHVKDEDDVATALADLPQAIESDRPTLLRQCGERRVLLIPAARAGSATWQPMLPWVGDLAELGGGIVGRFAEELRERGYDFDPSRFEPTARVRIAGGAADVEQWDPLSGTVSRPSVSAVDGGVEVTVDFSATPAAVLVWHASPTTEPAVPAATSTPWTRRPIDGAWTSRLVPTLDDRFGDLAVPGNLDPTLVQQWRLDHRVEREVDGGWRGVLVGQGTWAWRFGPVDATQAPPPLARDHAGELGGPGWTPVRYSLSRGIADDLVHARAFGPKGAVPEEFWHVQHAEPGDIVVLRTALPGTQDGVVTLAVAANGEKAVWWNGEHLGADPGGHLRLDRVEARPGPNLVEVRVTAEGTGPLRGYWALTSEPDAFVRPNWLVAGGGDGPVTARRGFVLPSPPRRFTLHLGTQGSATLSVNGRQVAAQGGHDPYGGRLRVQRYDLAGHLHVGENVVQVVLADDVLPALLVDAVAELADGTIVGLVTDGSWTLTRDGAPVTAGRARCHPYDPQWPLLRPRPHPLPGAIWLTGEPAGGVLDVTPDAWPGQPRPAEWFRLIVPPGAVFAHLPLAGGEFTAWLDGVEAQRDGNRIPLGSPDRERRVLTVRVPPAGGRTEGALWLGPPTFEVGPGRLSPGDWANAGLASYSGGVSYSRRLRLDAIAARLVLDLGTVRGTAEVAVNGVRVGARIWSPYRFDITDVVRAGDNDVEVTVFNTLAPLLDDVSPTTMVYAGQRTSGLSGPVSLLTTLED
jgi:hypothetical protein